MIDPAKGPKGFSLHLDGRTGFIALNTGNRSLKIDIELSGTNRCDFLVYIESLDSWALPARLAIDPAEKQQIVSDLRQWLSNNKIRTDLAFNPNA